MNVIVDYGAGNLGSILNMIKKVGGDAVISADPNVIADASKIVLPGVGAFDHGMSQLNDSGLLDVLSEKVLVEKTPVLGVCLGMQLLTKSSEEGKLPGLGWIDAVTKKFVFENELSDLKIPHMGWNTVSFSKENLLNIDSSDENRFYFVHSYFVECQDKKNILATSFYGHEFVSGLQQENIFGVQFHPEKSHKFGMKFFKIFLEFCHA